jgi:prepilin-type N-terminal cleavage/methylation domain-containing protein
MDRKGTTLIELMIALLIAAILAAGIYTTFRSQQHTYTVVEQVVDTQQSVRVAIDRMATEIGMAGFGLGNPSVLPGGVNGFTQVITTNSNDITIVGGFEQVKTTTDPKVPITITGIDTVAKTVTLSAATDEFDGAANKFISIGGLASHQVVSRTTNVLTLNQAPISAVGAYVFKIQAITYQVVNPDADGKPRLKRDENTGGGLQPLSENIESIQFVYYDSSGNTTTDPASVRRVRLTVMARADLADPDYKGGDSYRRRVLTSDIKLRNL